MNLPESPVGTARCGPTGAGPERGDPREYEVSTGHAAHQV